MLHHVRSWLKHFRSCFSTDWLEFVTLCQKSTHPLGFDLPGVDSDLVPESVSDEYPRRCRYHCRRRRRRRSYSPLIFGSL